MRSEAVKKCRLYSYVIGGGCFDFCVSLLIFFFRTVVMHLPNGFGRGLCGVIFNKVCIALAVAQGSK
jgi:hypothetical protein